MPLFRVDSVFPMFTGQPEDIVMNSLHFATEPGVSSSDMAANALAFLRPFWVSIYGNAADRVQYIDWESATFRVFNLDDPSPRVPAEENMGITGGGGDTTTIPTEVACVMSFRSNGEPGDVYQRRYNRIFIGALPNTAFAAATASSFPTFSQAWQVKVTDAAKALQLATNGPATLWVQVSNAGGTTRSLPVVGGWVDNSPDTQRRRSVDSSLRTTWVPD